jgi:hypothetical protein
MEGGERAGAELLLMKFLQYAEGQTGQVSAEENITANGLMLTL